MSGSVTVGHIPRPKKIPKRIPRWAWQLLIAQEAGKHDTRKTPTPLPKWYAAWKAWRLEPFKLTS
ncbi:MAG: hypothetical protein ACRD6W_01345 [Nitrososphaerales archaeon]